ncbi:hypothetical protein PQX77_006888, partial [Marasmius sp. AFHP31]
GLNRFGGLVRFGTATKNPRFSPTVDNPTQRDEAAEVLLREGQISSVTIDPTGSWLTFTCHSSTAVSTDVLPLTYSLSLSFDGRGYCNCPDWKSHGGACKHIRAALLKIDQYNSTRDTAKIPQIILPDNPAAARVLLAQIEQSNTLSHLAPPPPPHPNRLECISAAAAAVDDTLTLTSDEIFVPDSDPAVPEDISDTQSVSTDTPDIDNDIQAFDVALGSRNALNNQAVACTFFDFERALPKLAEWTEYLKSASHLSSEHDIERARRFSTHLMALSSEKNRLVAHTEGVSPAKPIIQNIVQHTR